MKDSNIDQKLREAIKAAYANAPAVKARFDKHGINPDEIRGVADLEKVPVLPKDELVRLQQTNPPFGGMLGLPLEQLTHICFSPGPLYEPLPDENDSAWEVARLSLQQAGFSAGDIVLNSLSYHLVPAGLLFDRALSRLGCTVVPGGTGNSDLQLKMMKDLSCTGYVGTPSFLMSLINKAVENGWDFKESFSLRKAIVTAEPLPPSLRQQLTETYGIFVVNAYGTAEFGLLGLNTGQGMAMELMPEPIVEVVDPDTGRRVGAGETGEVVATNFSRAYPLIRIGTGDMAMNVDPNPGSSSQEERSIILVGRSGDAAKVRGIFVHPNQLRFAAGQIPAIKAIQGVVSRPALKDQFGLRVEIEDGADLEVVSEQIKEAVRSLCRVRVDTVELLAAGNIKEGDPGMLDQRTWK